MVQVEVVEQVDEDGNDRADAAADLGRRHVGVWIPVGFSHRLVIAGTLLSVSFIVFFLPFPVLW